jgi:hypothetical protein
LENNIFPKHSFSFDLFSLFLFFFIIEVSEHSDLGIF